MRPAVPVRPASAALVLAVAAAVALPGASGTPEGAAAPKRDTVFRFTDTRIKSSSGLATVAAEPDYVFTINDSGPTRVFAVNRRTGESDATMRVADAENVDWEAVAAGRGRNLWIGDIGDNDGERSNITLYRFKLPGEVSTGFYEAKESFDLTYPDGPRDAETVLVNPDTNQVYVVTKDSKGGTLYRADDLGPGTNELTKLNTDLPPMITDGAFRSDGKRFVLRNYTTAHVYSTDGSKIGSFRLPEQEQGEGVAYTNNDKSLLLSSEGQRSEVLRVEVKEALGSGSKPSKESPSPASTEEATEDESGIGLVDALFFAGPFAIALVAAVVALLLHRRRPAASGAHGGGARARRYEKDRPYPPPDYAGLPSVADDDQSGWPVPPSSREGKDEQPRAGPPNRPEPGQRTPGSPPPPPLSGPRPPAAGSDSPPASSGRRAAGQGKRASGKSGARRRRRGRDDGGEPFWLRE